MAPWNGRSNMPFQFDMEYHTVGRLGLWSCMPMNISVRVAKSEMESAAAGDSCDTLWYTPTNQRYNSPINFKGTY